MTNPCRTCKFIGYAVVDPTQAVCTIDSPVQIIRDADSETCNYHEPISAVRGCPLEEP
jgi:hypothetical protein